MSKRLQVLVDERDLREIRRLARRKNVTEERHGCRVGAASTALGS